MKKIILTIVFALCSTVFSKAQAYDWMIAGKVTAVEGSYIPNSVYFKLDTGTGSCAAGTWLVWTGNFHGVSQPANVKAVFAQLLTAFTTGKTINFYGFDSYEGTACLGQHIHIVE